MLKDELNRLIKNRELEETKYYFDYHKANMNFVSGVTTYDAAMKALADANRAALEEIIKLKEAMII